MALSESRRRANDKYISEHYTRVALSMPKEEADVLRAYCAANDLTVAGFIRGLIRDAITAGAALEATPGVYCDGAGGGGNVSE